MRTDLKLNAGTITIVALAVAPVSAVTAGTPVARSPLAITAGSPFAGCYTAGFQFEISLAGGTPGDVYDATLSEGQRSLETVKGMTRFSSTGTGSVRFTHPDPVFSTGGAIAGIPITVTAEDRPRTGGMPVSSTLATITMTQVGFSVARNELRPDAPRTFAFSGDYYDADDYGFITNDIGSKVVRRFHIGHSNACGYVKGRAPLGPADGNPGTYRLYVYPSPRLDQRKAIGYETYSLFRPLSAERPQVACGPGACLAVR